MTTLFEGAYAKLNLTLDVHGKREDGYHDLTSVMQTISVRDDIEIDVGTGKPWELHCDKEGIPCDERNHAWKAAKVYLDTIGKRPDHQAMESAILAGDLGRVAENVWNVFDPVVTAEHLELNYIKSICNSYGSLAQQMTGSGSAVFAIMPSFEYAAVACSMLKDNYPQVFIAKPV